MKMLALATEIRDLEKENITNLTGLWKLMGFVPNQERNAKGIYRSVNWPHRYWQDWDISATFSERLDNPPLDRKNLVLPEFQINHKENVEYHSDKEALGLSLKFEQQAMLQVFTRWVCLNSFEVKVLREI
ncbi:MAG: hypothetical protein JKY14_06785 [Paraglaciecola sp.]|nr:hypothetical protein [Paraglaciecola sp.]